MQCNENSVKRGDSLRHCPPSEWFNNVLPYLIDNYTSLGEDIVSNKIIEYFVLALDK